MQAIYTATYPKTTTKTLKKTEKHEPQGVRECPKRRSGLGHVTHKKACKSHPDIATPHEEQMQKYEHVQPLKDMCMGRVCNVKEIGQVVGNGLA